MSFYSSSWLLLLFCQLRILQSGQGRLNKRQSEWSRRWWFETPSRSLWRQCNANHILNSVLMGALVWLLIYRVISNCLKAYWITELTSSRWLNTEYTYIKCISNWVTCFLHQALKLLMVVRGTIVYETSSYKRTRYNMVVMCTIHLSSYCILCY